MSSNKSTSNKKNKQYEVVTPALLKNIEKDKGDDVSVDNSDNNCVVCFKNVEIYSIGECDHPVCYECSTRMRVLCKQNECPICRRDMSQVIFSTEKLTYRQLEICNRSGLYDKKYRICFLSQTCQAAYYKLLDNTCPKCDDGPFDSFMLLKKHVQKSHDHFYCEICTDNLSVFSFERRCYSRENLGRHRREGDPDNKSHRGHPICQYCNLRYFDRDELFKHLRREHFFCYFCDADGFNCYYENYAALREHFKNDHFLCEDGDCAEEQFTGVFRSEIDLKAHIASVHAQSSSRSATKQLRTLEFEITLAPRTRQGGAGPSGNNESSRTAYRLRNGNTSTDTQNEFDYNNLNEPTQSTSCQPRWIDSQNEQEFPSLGGSSGTTFSLMPNVSIRTKAYGGTAGLARTKENFPALGGSSSSSVPNPSPSHNGSKKTASSMLKSSDRSKGGADNVKKPKQSGGGMVIHVSNRPNSSKDFPSLPGSSSKKSHLEEDFVSMPASSVYGNSVASKHRSLVESYESVNNTELTTASKILMVQQKPPEPVKKQPQVEAFVPKLNSRQNFPTLGNSSASSMVPQWVTLTKAQSKPLTESRKSKVAPPPLSTSSSNNNIATKSSQNSMSAIVKAPTPAANDATKQTAAKTNATTKKDKEKSVKKINEKKPESKNKKQLSSSDQKYNRDESPEPEIVPSATVLNAVSAKHRSLLDNYESAVKPGATKLSIVQRTNDSDTKSKAKSNENNVPKLNSRDNFPTLSGKSSIKQSTWPIENNNNNGSINFTDILRNSTVDNVNGSSTYEKKKGKNKSTGPPPGFNNDDNNDGFTNSPPPGFQKQNVTLNSVAKPKNNLTFTNSLGESYNILPGSHEYTPPINAAKRNQALFSTFQNVLNNTEAVDGFKQISQLFLNGDYNAQPYYEHCQAALGDKFDVIFPEMLVLLPNIGKQQELYLVHSQQEKQKPKQQQSKKKQQQQPLELEVCGKCKQVLSSFDLSNHYQVHTLESNFPTLNNNQNNGQSTAWKK